MTNTISEVTRDRMAELDRADGAHHGWCLRICFNSGVTVASEVRKQIEDYQHEGSPAPRFDPCEPFAVY